MRKHSLRRAAAAITSLALTASLFCTAFATTGSQPIKADYTNIKVMLDGKYLVLTDVNGTTVEPFAVNGTTYLPLRAVASALGLGVDWDAATSTAVLVSGGNQDAAATTRIPPQGRTISITQNADYADIKVTLDGSPLTLADANGNPVEPFAINGTTYLPLRAIATALGLEVGWNNEEHIAYLSSEPVTITADEAVFLVQGNLDEIYLNKTNDVYLELLGLTADEAEATFLQNVLLESEFFCLYWGIVDTDKGESFDALNSSLVNQITGLYKEIYSHAKYTVSPAVEMDNGNYAVDVVISPINVMTLADAAYEATNAAFQARYDLSHMTDAQYQAYCDAYAQMIIDLVKAQMPNLGYLPDVTVTLHVEKDANGYFSVNGDDFNDLDAYVIDYPTAS